MFKPQLLTQSVRVAVLAALATGFAAAKQSLFGSTPFVPFLFVVLALCIIISKFIEFSLDQLFEISGWWRKFLLGKNNIEGYWLNSVSLDGETRIGIYQIYYDNNAYRVMGCQYDTSGVQMASWKSRLLEFDGSELNYMYETRYQNDSKTQFGCSTIVFMRSRPTREPLAANGYFLDLAAGGATHTFQSVRLSESQAEQFAHADRAFVQRLLASDA